ncbi:hypothetical protein GCM10009639_07910 [Kitasatospora putterlickiae]|uniref:DUF397 domain-containing protein n=1 Tax=Kitasatospora putterlickiae TaxID=221725 RepID=A0ABP4I9Y8_9ACTN
MQHFDLADARWRKSTYSGQGGECVEVASNLLGLVPVRDSKDPEGPALVFPTSAWRSFVTAVQASEFDTI